MGTKEIDDFLKIEYKSISEAHFNVSHRITSFFQYMIAIYTAPLFLMSSNVNMDNNSRGIVFLFISVIGFFIIMYVNQLRCESLLYANSINSIRNFFYNESTLNIEFLKTYNVLPIQKRKPAFIDSYQFIWIFLTSTFINSGYAIYGLSNFDLDFVIPYFILLFIFTVIIQFSIYILITRNTEAGQNFYKHRIGVDIDGVLNEHEEQFCKFSKTLLNKDILPHQITQIPVNRIPGIGITTEDERIIFNDQDYWKTIPDKKLAVENLAEIRNTLGFEIYLFTWRPWGYKKNVNNSLMNLAIKLLQGKKWESSFSIIDYVKKWTKEKQSQSKFSIKEITLKWLYEKGFEFKKIIFEKGNYNLPNTVGKALFENRFYYSSKWKIKYFVDDEPKKAIKLSFVCKYVFLMEHEYNKEAIMPINVIRVRDWNEIFDNIKSLE